MVPETKSDNAVIPAKAGIQVQAGFRLTSGKTVAVCNCRRTTILSGNT